MTHLKDGEFRSFNSFQTFKTFKERRNINAIRQSRPKAQVSIKVLDVEDPILSVEQSRFPSFPNGV